MSIIEVAWLLATAWVVGAWYGKRLAKWSTRKQRKETAALRKKARELRTRALVRDEITQILDVRDCITTSTANVREVN